MTSCELRVESFGDLVVTVLFVRRQQSVKRLILHVGFVIEVQFYF